MRFNINAARAAQEESQSRRLVLDEGWYRGKVLSAEEVQSSKGTEGIALMIRVQTGMEDHPKHAFKDSIYHTRADGSVIDFGNRRVYQLVVLNGAKPNAKGEYDVTDFEGPCLVRLGVKPPETFTGKDGNPVKAGARNSVMEFAAEDSGNGPIVGEDEPEAVVAPESEPEERGRTPEEEIDDIPF